MTTPRITLYTTRNCPHCRQAKQYLQRRGLRFPALDGVPVIMVGDIRIDGFDRRRLDAVLKT